MSKLPDAVPCPDKPPLCLRGGYLCVAAPLEFREACFSVPALRALRRMRPQATLAVLCPESQQPLWKSVTELDGVIVYPDKASSRKIARILADEDTRFESAIAWEAGEAAKAFARVEVLQRLGYPAAKLAKYLTDTVEVVLEPGPIQHRVRHYLNLVKKLGGDAFVKSNFQPPPLPPAPEKLRVALAPASEYGVSYQWPIERFKEVVEIMTERYREIEWVILGVGREAAQHERCEELSNRLGGEVRNYSGEWGLEKTLQSLPHCSVLLACDGETAHLAAHVGLPAVVIFGPDEPEWRRPLGKQSHVLREHVACSPCYLSRCPLDHRCLNEVTVEQVVEELGGVLALRYGSE